MGNQLARGLVLGAIFLVAPAAGTCAAQSAETPPPPDFEWHMPSRYGAERAGQGFVETQAYEVRRGPWRVYLRTTGRACRPGASHRWTAGSGRRLKTTRLGPCRYRLRVATEGAYRIRLATRLKGGARVPSVSRRIVVRDWLIVAVGDSVASGEGVPEASSFFSPAPWQSARCHRSAQAGVARAARQIESDGGHSSVTFVHLACSGAEIMTGLLGPYAGAVPPRSEPPLEPQIAILDRIGKVRKVDAVLLSIGANDVHFSEVAAFCAAVPNKDCFSRPLPRRFGGNGSRTAIDAVRADLRKLDKSYAHLARRLAVTVPPSRVYVTEYFDPTHDERGLACEKLFGAIGPGEVEQAQSQILIPLNRAVARAASSHGWTHVNGIAAAFRTHGYCADESAWVSTLSDSLRQLGGVAGRHRGILHPNRLGHEAIGALVAAGLERDLYPQRDFPPRPFPSPAPDSADAIQAWVLAAGAGALLLLPLLAAFVAIAIPSALLVTVLWLGWDSVTPLLIGFVGGAMAIVALGRRGTETQSGLDDFSGNRMRAAARPLVSLAKTIRPLFLPLFVIVAIGAVELPFVAQALLSAVLIVLAWTLIVAPEARKSEVERWEPSLIRKIALHSAVAIGLGALAVFVARLLDFLASPYLDAIGDLAGGLLLVAVLLWVAAVAMRLISFATTPLRAVLSFDLGLALIVLAMAFGVLPGNSDVRDAWPPLAVVFGGAAVLLLVIEVVLSAVGNTVPATLPRRSPIRRLAGAGFGVAAVAAAVLAASTAYGLVDAAREDHPLNPPTEESADARVPAPATVSGERGLELARRYAPVLVFSEGERWAPTRVGPYVKDARLTGPPGTRENVELGELPTSCPGIGRTRCHKLSIECDSGGEDCAEAEHREAGRLYRDGAVYVRVLRKRRKGQERPHGAFIQSGPFRDRLEMLIQYWYFYRYNEWRAPVFAGLLIQRHEADWEAVTIGLDRERRPLFVADSAHCGGSWRPWQKVEASTRLPGPHTHPLVAVAEGSHANYPSASEKRSPDWAHCAGAPNGVLTAISYASNIRDRTSFGWLWYPPPDGWVKVTADRPPMSFPGVWGADGEITLRNFRPNVLSDSEAAPATPSLQPLWQDPVETIFCDRYKPAECIRDGD